MDTNGRWFMKEKKEKILLKEGMGDEGKGKEGRDERKGEG